MSKRKTTDSDAQQPGGLGVWVVGALGGLATTMIAGARLISRGLASTSGLITASPPFSAAEVCDLDSIRFGGCDVREGRLFDAAVQIYRETNTLRYDHLLEIRDELERIDEDITAGTTINCGRAINRLADKKLRRERRALATIVEDIVEEIAAFRERHGLRDVIVVNVASTEPPLALDRDHGSIAGIRRILAANDRDRVRASTLYAWAALSAGCPFLNFTPSNACITPAHVKLAHRRRLPLMGNDGKTGETLVKSALAPMFKYRNLRVLTWQGYNILGDRDGEILAEDQNKASKIATKDSVLSSILGYPLHTHVGIDYAPSLSDLKTAWDFIHFQGFLDYKMTLQFTWQGCDAILAAPIVLDMVRLLDFAKRHGEIGLATHLACFFKSPLGVDEHDLHFQFHHLLAYLAEHADRKKTALRRPVGGSEGRDS